MLLWRTQLLLLLISVMQHLYRGLVPALRHNVHATVALHHLRRNTVKVVLYSSYSNGGDRNGDGYDRNGRGDRHRRPKDIINNTPGVDAGNFPRSPRIVDNNPRREGVDGNRRTSSFVKTDSTRDISSNFRQRVSGSSFDEVRPRGGQSYRGTTGGERASYDRKPRSNEYVDDDGTTGEERFPDRRYELRYDRDDNREPAYGYYDGDHLYGIAPVRLALLAGKREMKELLVQEGMDLSNKKDSKAAKEILQAAQTRGIDIREFSKHDLNMLTDNRPHQGFVLRAMPLQFTRLAHLDAVDQYSCVLALDEVWDPQNFGALLRTSYFLKCDKVVVCAKNSAPLSPVVSKASAGALEVMEVYSTDNLMKFLDKSRDNGWQVHVCLCCLICYFSLSSDSTIIDTRL